MGRNFSDFNTRVAFSEVKPVAGPEAEEELTEVFSCWAEVDTVRLRDLEQAKINGTLEDLTIAIRDTRGEFVPNNKQFVSVDASGYHGKHFNVKSAQPDLKDKRFTLVVAGLIT